MGESVNLEMQGQQTPLRVVDTQAYISMLCDIVEQGREVPLNISGSSMSPFLIHQRDAVMLSRITSPPQKGDIVLFCREDGSFVVHRVRKVCEKGYYMIGDGQTGSEGPVPVDRLRAIVTKVRRKGDWMGSNSLMWRFFASVWLQVIPLRRLFVRLWQIIERIKRH